MKHTRNRLKAAALELFLDQGFAKTTIGAIEKKAGLLPRSGGFYRHFDSKAALALAIAQEDIVEREEEFDLPSLLPLGDTRAELLLIARGYLRANKRQKKVYPLIQELRILNVLGDFEQSANEDMLLWLNRWVASKPAGRNLAEVEISALTLNVFGALLFFTTKLLQGIEVPDLPTELFVDRWADHWAEWLDRAVAPEV